MKYERFEDLPVWQAGRELTLRVFKLTDDRRLHYKGDLADQLERAVLSITNNIAEGFERGTTQELISFLYYARGSAGEVRSILKVALGIPGLASLHASVAELITAAEAVSRQLRAWTEALQNEEIKGQRYLTEQGRQAYDVDQRAARFMAQLKAGNDELQRQRLAQRGQTPEP